MYNSLTTYINDTKGLSTITPTEEKFLTKRIQKGNKKAREQMILANLRLVITIALRFINKGLSLPDLISEGNIGLIMAVDRFDPKYSNKFSTYAGWWIKKHIKEALNQNKTIRLPKNQLGNLSLMHKITKELIKKTGKSPSIKDLAKKLRTSCNNVKRWQSNSDIQIFSLDGGDYYDSNSYSDTIADSRALMPYENIDKQQHLLNLRDKIQLLTKKEQHILKRRFGLGDIKQMSLQALGNQHHFSRERIRQIESNAIEKLRGLMMKNDYNIKGE